MSFPISKKEAEAWVTLTGDLRHARQTQQRLFALAEEKPHLVAPYLDGLPEEAIQQYWILRKLHSISSTAQSRL